jgi:hypothetical protein
MFLALASVWTERPIYASIAAVGILLPQTLWAVDFLGTLIGYPLVGMTAYMFDPKIPFCARALSFFHFWLPFFLVYLVWQLGYDRRGLRAWTILAVVLLLVCYLWLPAPPATTPDQPVNVNYVYGPSDQKPQEWMDGRLWLASLLVGLPVLVFLPTHLLLNASFGSATKSIEPLSVARASSPSAH